MCTFRRWDQPEGKPPQKPDGREFRVLYVSPTLDAAIDKLTEGRGPLAGMAGSISLKQHVEAGIPIGHCLAEIGQKIRYHPSIGTVLTVLQAVEEYAKRGNDISAFEDTLRLLEKTEGGNVRTKATELLGIIERAKTPE
jgi:hypothetical protein